MKKILFIVVVFVFALAGCAKFERDAEIKKTETGAPQIIEASFTTTSLSASIVPADENTNYYSYAVLPGTKKSDIDAGSILNTKIADAIVAECVCAAECDTIKLELDELNEGETYTLYAVASSKTGTLSPVAARVFILDDDVKPSFSPEDATYEISEADSSVVISIPFNRSLKFGDGAKVTVSEWGIFDTSDLREIPNVGYLIGTPLSTFELTAEGGAISIDDNSLVVSVPGAVYAPGKVLSVTFKAGTVISLPVSEGGQADVPCDAYDEEYVFFGSGPYEGKGVFIEYPATTFTLEEDPENPTFVLASDWQEASFSIISANKIAYCEKSIGEALYHMSDSEYTSERKAPLSAWAFSLNERCDTVSVVLPTQPKAGENIHFEIGEAVFYDIYGNANEALETTVFNCGNLEIGLSAVTTCNALEYSAQPAVSTTYYYLGYLPGDGQDKSDEEVITSVKDKIQQWATIDEISFEEEYLEYFACQADTTLTALNLVAETTYTVFAFYMNPDGTVISDVFRESCTTPSFVRPTATTGTYYMDENSIYECSLAGRSITWKDGATAEKPDTLIISGCGYNKDSDYKFTVDKSGNAILLESSFGIDNIYLQEAYVVNPMYAYYQSYISPEEGRLHIGCLYYIEGGAISNNPDYFDFDDSAAAPTGVKNCVSKAAVKPTPSKAKVSLHRVERRRK